MNCTVAAGNCRAANLLNEIEIKDNFFLNMSDEENCALRPDGTLKEAHEISFFNSPSDQNPISTVHNGSSTEDDELPDPAAISRGLKGKAPARCVGSKRVPKLSAKVRANGSLNTFFTKTFTGNLTTRHSAH